LERLRQELSKLGWIGGEVYHDRLPVCGGENDRLPALAADLVRHKVNLIVVTATPAALAAKSATTSHPHLHDERWDPVAAGLVANLARPGGNITGLSILAPEISGKQLELLKEILPGLSRVVVLGTSTQPGNTQALKELEVAAGTLGVGKERANAVLVLNSPVFNSQRTYIADLAKNRYRRHTGRQNLPRPAVS
jgi:putative tryptophan/tyrosine transport system substrate-binding protein